MAFSRSFNIHVIKRSLTIVDVHGTCAALRSHRDGAVARAAAAAAASARARSGGERADGRHACGHAAVQRRAVRGQGDVGLCVGPPAERRGARARASGLRGRWRLRIRSRNVVELGPRCKGHKIKSGRFPQFHGGHVPQTGPKIHRKTAFWALQIQIFSRCAPNHGGRAAGASRVLALWGVFQTLIEILAQTNHFPDLTWFCYHLFEFRH